MKKTVCILALLCLLLPCAFAESIDLSGLSFAELADLRDRCQMEMMNRDEWQEVTVPQGMWEVGKDIPAGTWTVRCADINRRDYMMKEADITIGDMLDETGTEISYKGNKTMVTIYNPNHEDYSAGAAVEFTFTVNTGEYIHISEYYNRVVFTPYTGKPDLGFK